MVFSYISLFSTVLFCNAILIIISIIMNRTSRILRFGYSTIVLLILAVALRLAFPFEILLINYDIYMPDIVAKYLTMINEPFFNTGLRIEDVLYIVWATGTIVMLFRLFYETYTFQECVRKTAIDLTQTEKIRAVLSTYQEKHFSGLRVYKTPCVTSPLLCGFFRQRILLPESVSYDEADLDYILCHEITHYNSLDMYLKLLVALIHCVFWWNPCTRVIQRKLNTMLEIRVDDRVIQRTGSDVAYMTALLNASKAEVNATRVPIMAFASSKSELKKRFEYMTGRKTNQRGRGLFVGCMVILFLLSYVFILIPDYIDPKVLEEEGTFVLTPDNAYLIDKGDGSYDVYYNGEYLYNETELIWGLDELEIINKENK